MAQLPAQVVREALPVYEDPVLRERLRESVRKGLPVDAVKVLQGELKRLGVARPSQFVNRIVSRATRQRRERLTREQAETVLRISAIVALAVYVWGDEGDASEFLNRAHPMLGGEKPIEMALTEGGARHVEEILWGLYNCLPV